jgi:hypothetical protein
MVLMVSALALSVSAQDIFFPTKEGQVLTTVELGKSGKAEGYSSITVKKATGSGRNFTVEYFAEKFDKNKKPVQVAGSPGVSFTLKVTDGVVETDMRSLIPPGMAGNVEITGDNIKVPSSLKVGDKLDDAKFSMTMDIGGMKMVTNTAITDRKCVAVEDVKVPAGTYKGYKLVETSTATVMGQTVVTSAHTWYAHGVGAVKSESFDSGGKLLSSTQLYSVK